MVTTAADPCPPDQEVHAIAALTTLLWAAAYFAVFVPLALLTRLLGGRRSLGHGTAKADTYWLSRQDHPFDDMRRQGRARQSIDGRRVPGRDTAR